MTELLISLSSPSSNVKTSIVIEGIDKVLLYCNLPSSSSSTSDMDIDDDSDGSYSNCGCGENQLAHYETDGAVCQDLPERCQRQVDGPIGSAAEYSAQPAVVNEDIDEEIGSAVSDTEPESIVGPHSMEVEVESSSDVNPPPANQLALFETIKETALPRLQLRNRVKLWRRSVTRETAEHLYKKSKKTPLYMSKREQKCQAQISINVLGNSQQLNVKVGTNPMVHK
ncbi:hypothetical protein BJ165DRAFT_1406052 [Panaeolus papilionaceus]|nr:hypothetical protein BJ165DRAFT_1406052 [Panaeolus papilionaceus]